MENLSFIFLVLAAAGTGLAALGLDERLGWGGLLCFMLAQLF